MQRKLAMHIRWMLGGTAKSSMKVPVAVYAVLSTIALATGWIDSRIHGSTRPLLLSDWAVFCIREVITSGRREIAQSRLNWLNLRFHSGYQISL